jgi:hypothetical protein
MTSICLLTRSKTSCQAWRPTTGLLNYAGSPTPPLAERASADTVNPRHSRNQLPADLPRGGRLRPGAGREPDAQRSHPRAHLPIHPPLTCPDSKWIRHACIHPRTPDRADREQLRNEVGEQRRPVLQESLERHRAEEQGARSSAPTGMARIASRYQPIPIRHRNMRRSKSRNPARPSVAAVMRNAGSAKPKTAPMALNGRGGAPKNSTGIQLAQKITNASTRSQPTGRRPTNDLTPDQNRRLSDRSRTGPSHLS